MVRRSARDRLTCAATPRVVFPRAAAIHACGWYGETRAERPSVARAERLEVLSLGTGSRLDGGDASLAIACHAGRLDELF